VTYSSDAGEPARLHQAHGDGPDSLYRLLVESVRDYAIFALDPKGYILSWNAGAERIKGYTADEAIGKHFSVFYSRDLVAQGFPEFELRTAANTGRFEVDGWRIRKDGSRFWANVVITALRDSDGELVGFAKVTRDLTERRDAEQALRHSEEIFRVLVSGVKDYAIFMLDPAGRIETWNEGAQRIKGYRPDEIIGQSFEKFYPEADIAAGKPARELEIAVRVGKYEEEGWRVRKDGTTFWASVLITALRNPAGELVGFAKVTRDLTERRAAEQQAILVAQKAAAQEAERAASELRERELRAFTDELQRQAAALEARNRETAEAQRRADDANRVKSQFLASMSHELRTPLNAIGGYADLLTMGLSGPVTPEQVEQLGRIKRSQQYLLGIINDILNFSRLEAGQLTYDIAPVLVRPILDAVMQMVLPQLVAKNLHLQPVECPGDLVAWADRAKVEQILVNLVSNAMKFTSAGGSVGMTSELGAGDRVAIRVRDTGSGISAEHQRVIFEPFVQVGRSLTSASQGTGLGLAISRDLAIAMGGDLTVESTVGMGSTFTLTLPLEPRGGG
jgi:PAS domain S-box-containing protein